MGPYNYYDEDTYVSIYNKTTNEYNSLPAKAGNYEFYVSVYNKNTKELFDRRSAQCKVIKITVSLALGGYFFIAKM